LLDNFRSEVSDIGDDENFVVCPLCMKKLQRVAMEEHLESCASMEMTQVDNSVPFIFDSSQPSTSTGITHNNRTKIHKAVAAKKPLESTADATTDCETQSQKDCKEVAAAGKYLISSKFQYF
jgi:hypothetical protein